MTEVALLTRDVGMAENTDPTGRKFKIHPKKNTSLLCIMADDGNNLPRDLEGMFTDPTKAQIAIERYLRAAWDYNDAAAERLARKNKTEEIEVRRSLLEEEEVAEDATTKPAPKKRGRPKKDK